MKRLGFLFSVLGMAAVQAVGVAKAEWPERPLTMVMQFSPGGGLDQVLLPLKPHMEKRLGQSVLYSYKPGAGGRIGWEIIHDKGDAYTIGGLVLPHLPNSTLFATPKYSIDDFVPVAVIQSDVPIWFVRKDSPINTMGDLIAAAKKRPGGVTMAIGSFTGEHYISVALVEEKAGVKFRAVNVKGGSKVMSNIVGGHFEVGVSRPASILRIRDEIKGIGLLAAGHSELFPEAKTFDEQFPAWKIPHMTSATGVLANRAFKDKDPKGFARLVKVVKESLETPEYQDMLKKSGRSYTYMGPDAANKLLKDTYETMKAYKPLIEAAKTKK
ncbi:MAG: tripartite tricarboxylate transporter substrate binding protein [Rhodospirillales bacterium]|jgi:tripartite-type tricarboxylate transporter receptor subunit TctC|nr:tripartite tricarboxylate transporter substrate binding protein [Rhodospirillales bacterium]